MTPVRLSAVVLFALVADTALGQGFTRPLPTPAPVRTPGGRVVPWSPNNLPGIGRPVPPINVPWFGGIGYSYWSSYPSTYDSLPLPGYDPFPAAPTAPAAPPAQSGPPAIVPELPAEWTIEFPADVAVTLNGSTAAGDGKVRKLTSPPLKPHETYTFKVAATWTADGKQYEWDRTLTLEAGQRSRSVVARGFLVEK